MKKWNSSLIFPISIVIMLVVSGLLYPSLPEQVPSHWNFRGEVDGYMPRLQAILFLPALSAGIWLLMWIAPRLDPRRDSYEKFSESYLRLIQAIALFLLGLHILMLTQYDNPQIMTKAIMAGVGLLLAAIGNEMGRFRQTWFTGIRTPWTLADERVWNKTHRVGARWFVGVGITNMILAFVLPTEVSTGVLLVTVIGMTIGLVVYSYVLYQRYNG